MSVSDLLNIIRCDETAINFNGQLSMIDRDSALHMSAYGDFLVDRAEFYAQDGKVLCEITLKCEFQRRGA